MPLCLPRAVFDLIVRHLVAVEDEREFVLDACFPKPGEERERMCAMFDQYTLRLNELIGRVKVREGKGGVMPTDLELPFVMVGSEVAVMGLARGEHALYRLQHPFRTDGGGLEISYVSPLGAALLLKEPGDEVVVETPAGGFAGRIESIRLVF